MTLWRDPRVLGDEWCPPQLIGRQDLQRELSEMRPVPFHPHPRAAVVLHGPRGVGTSALAAEFVRDLLTAWGRGPRSHPPLVLRTDVARTPSPGRTIGALFRVLDPSSGNRGASTEQLTMLLLRRLRSLQRPTVVWLDQVRRSSAELSRILLPLISPEGFLPEGGDGLPLLAVVVSGEMDPLEPVDVAGAFPPTMPILRRKVRPLAPGQMLEALKVRSRLAFEEPPDEEALVVLRDLLISHGWGLSAAGLTLEEAARRAQARGGGRILSEDVRRPAQLHLSHRHARLFDACLLQVLREATSLGIQRVPMSHLRSRLGELCREEGLAAPTQARLWRHLISLEQAGAFRREVQLGGVGGSRTVLCLPPAPSTVPSEMSSVGIWTTVAHHPSIAVGGLDVAARPEVVPRNLGGVPSGPLG